MHMTEFCQKLEKDEFYTERGFHYECDYDNKISFQTFLSYQNGKAIECYFNFYFEASEHVEIVVKALSPITNETASIITQNIADITDHKLFVIVERASLSVAGMYNINDVDLCSKTMKMIINGIVNTKTFRLIG